MQGILPVVIGDACHDQAVRFAPAFFLTNLRPHCHRHRTGGDDKRLTVETGAEALLLIATSAMGIEHDVIEHGFAHIAVTQIIRAGYHRAGSSATDGGIQSLVNTIKVSDIAGAVAILILTPRRRDRPIPRFAEFTLQTKHRIDRIYVLVLIAHTRFEQAPALQ